MIRTTTLCMLIVATVWASAWNWAIAGDPDDSQPKRHITVLDKGITMLSSKTLESCKFQTRQLLSFDTGRPGPERTFLVLDIEADFAAGPTLDMMAFMLRERDATDKVLFPIGFWAGRQMVPSRFCRTEDGALGYFDADKKIRIMGNPITRPPGQIYFAYMQDNDGKDIHWPGGKASVSLLYEIPRSARDLELDRGEKVEIQLKRRALGPSAKLRTATPSEAAERLSTTCAVVQRDGRTVVLENVRVFYEAPDPAGGMWLGGRPTKELHSLRVILTGNSGKSTSKEVADIPLSAINRITLTPHGIFKPTWEVLKKDGTTVTINWYGGCYYEEVDSKGRTLKRLDDHPQIVAGIANPTQAFKVRMHVEGFKGVVRASQGPPREELIRLANIAELTFSVAAPRTPSAKE